MSRVTTVDPRQLARRSVSAGPLKYLAVVRTQVLYGLAYPADLAGRSIAIALFLWIFFHLWRAAYATTGQQTIAGLSLRDTLWYLMLAEAIALSRPRLSGAIAEAVRSGSIAYQLHRPCSFLLYQAGMAVGDSSLRLAANLLAGGGLVWLLVGPPPDPRAWPLVLVAILGAWALDCCLSAGIGLLAFVTEEIAAFEWIYSKLLMTLGGLLIPLDFYPDWLKDVAMHLPFAYTLYGPARAFVGPGILAFGALFVGQAIWLAGLGTLVWLCYRRALRWLNVNGG
jgi:ABC-2 type transport system permease protein